MAREEIWLSSQWFMDKFIAFIDILGFSDLVQQRESEGNANFDDLLELTKKLGTQADRERFAQHGPAMCPGSKYISRDLAFCITQISDCVVVSAEVSPAALINLCQHCFRVSIDLLVAGHLCRGYVTRGNVFHSASQFFGTGYQRAVEGEKSVSVFQTDDLDRGTPFIQIDRSVCDYVQTSGDRCVQDMFGRMTESDCTEIAISPFPSLKNIPSTLIDDHFDPNKFKASVARSRDNIIQLLIQLDRYESTATEKARRKIEHYRRKLTEVLETKKREYEQMEKLAAQISTRR